MHNILQITQVSLVGANMCVGFEHPYLIVFILSVFSCLATGHEGAKCSLKDGSEGICKFLKKCPTAVQLIRIGVDPVICGFEEAETIVCCKNDQNRTNVTNTTVVTNRDATRTPGDTAKRKCKEYAACAYEKITAPTLLLKPHFTETLFCDFQRNKLIAGKTLTSRREFPHMALIGFKYMREITWQCGGSLISENFILTSAHCLVLPIEGATKLVRLGLTNKEDPRHMQERTVSEFIPHPKYNNTRYHDIGLLRLSKKIEFNTYVRPACLQTEKKIAYDLAIASGWGLIDLGEEPSDDLLAVVMSFINAKKCNESYKEDISSQWELENGIVDDLMICTGTFDAIGTTGRGDGGSPVQVYHKETKEIKCMYNIIGVISFGKYTDYLEDHPVVLTRVSAYTKWLEDTVWPQ